MKVAIIQYSPVWEDIKTNLNKLDSLFSKIHPETEMVILPEMFNTGFSMNSKIAQAENDSTLEWMKKKSDKFIITGSIAYNENGNLFNRLFVLQNGKVLGTYNKRKLFGMAKEDKIFQAGTQNLTLNIKKYHFSFFICYDLRFPEIMRNTNEQDICVIVASWPEKRIAHWNTLLKARAIENQVYMLACNRIGMDGNDINYNGCSQVILPDGVVVSKETKQEAILYVDLSKKLIEETRRKLPFLKDQ